MDRDFVIDGTGRVVRAGDRVLVNQLSLTDNFGPATVAEVLGERHVAVVFDSGIQDDGVSVIRIKREDDGETSEGKPLWCWR